MRKQNCERATMEVFSVSVALHSRWRYKDEMYERVENSHPVFRTR